MSSDMYWERTSPSLGQSSRTSSQHSESPSYQSYQSRSTAPTEHSYRPYLPRHDTCDPVIEGRSRYYENEQLMPSDNRRASIDTYASTTPSEEDITEDDFSPYDEPSLAGYHPVGSDAIPATPRDFAELFPSTQRLSIRHDDATVDGNMNLRVDMQVETRSGQRRPLTLFHLRMHDLKKREFSFRRYCRESGREVCHSVRKYNTSAAQKRPALHSFSSALSTLRIKPQTPKIPSASGLNRSDSGYESMYGFEDAGSEARNRPAAASRRASLMPTNTIKLEFSNYAHVDVKRRGAGSSKRYDFEYWGVSYSWRRRAQRNGELEEVSYHLHRTDHEEALAHIVPVPLTIAQASEEAAKGGWIPPCSMWITDDKIITGLPDLSDVVVSTGLMALVDDCIKRRWHSKRGRQLPIPLARSSSFRMNMEYVGPKRLIDEVFNRTAHRPTWSRQPTMLQYG